MTDILAKRYVDEGIDPITKAFCLIDGKIYMTVAGMEIKAMRSGVLTGKGSVQFCPPDEEIEPANPMGTFIRSPKWAIGSYERLVMDQSRTFKSDPVFFTEYAKKRWHYEKPFMFLAKIARACALRHAFPDIFAGVVSYEEQECDLGFDNDIPQKSNISVQELDTKQIVPSPSPQAISNMVAQIFKQGLEAAQNTEGTC